MRRKGFLLVVMGLICLAGGCSGASDSDKENEVPVVQDLNIQTESTSVSSSEDSH